MNQSHDFHGVERITVKPSSAVPSALRIALHFADGTTATVHCYAPHSWGDKTPPKIETPDGS